MGANRNLTTDLSQPADILADGVMTVEDAVAFTTYSRTTLYEMMESGELAYVLRGTRRAIPKRALIEILRKGLVPAKV